MLELKQEPNLKKSKNLKINYIDIQDFKNIDYISTPLEDWNVVWAWNGEWKTSFIDAIFTAISWNKFFWVGNISAWSLVRNEKDKAVIRLSIQWESEEIIIHREFKKWTEKKPAWSTKLIAEINWEKISQARLDDIVNSLTVDPLKLASLSNTDQIKEIKNIIDLDTSEIDSKILKQEESSREAGIYKKHAQARYDDMSTGWVLDRVEKVNIDELYRVKELFQKKNDKLREFASIEKQIKELQNKLEIIRTEGAVISWEIKDSDYKTIEEIQVKINDASVINEKASKYESFISSKNELDICNKSHAEEVSYLNRLRSQRSDLVAWSNLPAWMEIFEDKGIIVDWIEYRLLNTAKKIEIAIDLIILSGNPLRVIRIEQGGEFDIKTLEKVKEKIISNNFQIFIERPIIDKYDSIIISDWEILEWKEKEDFMKNQ